MENRRYLLVIVVFALTIVVVSLLLARFPTVSAQSKNFQTVFLNIQQQAKADPHFPFTVESYGPTSATNPAVGITTINASANSIVDIGEDFVCLGSIQMGSGASDVKTVCLPYTAIVRVQAQNTLYK